MKNIMLQASVYISEPKCGTKSIFDFLLGDIGEGGTPEPIPNSEVKPFIADGTAHKSVGE